MMGHMPKEVDMTNSEMAPLSIAPMMELTTRHYRYMMRLITKKTLLYTEMIVDQTLIHQKRNLHFFLGHDQREYPLVVQLGGNSTNGLEAAVNICEENGKFSEINLNVGCPSAKVSGGCFGARLMLDPELVCKLTQSMRDQLTTNIPVTVKCRIGVDDKDSYEDLKYFIETVSASGVQQFIVHARKCLLDGLNTHQNRTIPPLMYDVVYRLAEDFPHLQFALNGGVQTLDEAEEHLTNSNIKGIMIGRAAYSNPWMFRDADRKFFGTPNPGRTRRQVVSEYLDYAEALQVDWGKVREGDAYSMPTSELVKPLLGLFSGERGGKVFKRHIAETWKACKGNIELRELVEGAMEARIPSHVLDDNGLDHVDS